MTAIATTADHLVVVISDVEMGAGGVLDDFPDSAFIAELLEPSGRGAHAGMPVDVVFNGDTFDFLKTSVDGHYPRHVTEAIALAKLERIIGAHAAFFEGLRSFLTGSDAPRRAHFIVGNHDAELVFDAGRRRIEEEAGVHGIRFPGFALDFGDVHIEHGSQGDPMFQVDPERAMLLAARQHVLDGAPVGEPEHEVEVADRILRIATRMWAAEHGHRAAGPAKGAEGVGELGGLREGPDEHQIDLVRDLGGQVAVARVAHEGDVVARLLAPPRDHLRHDAREVRVHDAAVEPLRGSTGYQIDHCDLELCLRHAGHRPWVGGLRRVGHGTKRIDRRRIS